jgi:hypothetical protein
LRHRQKRSASSPAFRHKAGICRVALSHLASTAGMNEPELNDLIDEAVQWAREH